MRISKKYQFFNSLFNKTLLICLLLFSISNDTFSQNICSEFYNKFSIFKDGCYGDGYEPENYKKTRLETIGKIIKFSCGDEFLALKEECPGIVGIYTYANKKSIYGTFKFDSDGRVVLLQIRTTLDENYKIITNESFWLKSINSFEEAIRYSNNYFSAPNDQPLCSKDIFQLQTIVYSKTGKNQELLKHLKTFNPVLFKDCDENSNFKLSNRYEKISIGELIKQTSNLQNEDILTVLGNLDLYQNELGELYRAFPKRTEYFDIRFYNYITGKHKPGYTNWHSSLGTFDFYLENFKKYPERVNSIKKLRQEQEIEELKSELASQKQNNTNAEMERMNLNRPCIFNFHKTEEKNDDYYYYYRLKIPLKNGEYDVKSNWITHYTDNNYWFANGTGNSNADFKNKNDAITYISNHYGCANWYEQK